MIKRKRNSHQEAENHDRWMVSYADFVTLLFAFFVVMYSISSVNKGKFVTFSESLDQALKVEKSGREIEPVLNKNDPTTIQPIELPNLMTTDERELSQEILQEKQRLDNVSEKFKSELQAYVDSSLVSIKKHDFWIELEMNSELLFASGKADISPKAQVVLAKVADLVREIPNVINIEGYTDDVPISNGFYSSNWDLSSARATSVVKELVKDNIPATRLSATGYGEFHPIAENLNEENRFKNRRVVLVLMSQAFSRYGMTDAQRAKALNFTPTLEKDTTDKTGIAPMVKP
ncbi:flagellar motor protein MotB [Methylomonas sp. AM2-LC]|uniref:flagellar motor protein MotB n=1 Tax=Methylomonas sp. AM2-LC TaxID=3153301 RepID=UPI0032641091